MTRQPLLGGKRRLLGATYNHRRFIWHYARSRRRWPTLEEWRFIVLGRWSGF
jgi:hypothetical protein